jgi:hypothetical protein
VQDDLYRLPEVTKILDFDSLNPAVATCAVLVISNSAFCPLRVFTLFFRFSETIAIISQTTVLI